MDSIPDHVLSRYTVLRRYANSIRGYYGHPVYLVGSALRPDNLNPRDWDIRVMLPDDEFALRFGNGRETEYVIGRWMGEACDGNWTSIRWNWSRECVKRSLQASRELLLNVDFQVQPERNWYENKPRLQIDTKDTDWQ